jgi:hypothetical protein
VIGMTLTQPDPPQMQDLLQLRPGWVVGLVGSPGSGLTRLGLAMLAPPARLAPVVALDVRGWLCPPAAWEVGIEPERLVVVRCPQSQAWPAVVAALLEGVRAVYAEVPAGVGDNQLRRLGALARARRSGLVLRPLRGDLPAGVAHIRVRAEAVAWEGTAQGHGRLRERRLTLQASGKGAAGMDRLLMVEDDGTDALRVVSGLAAAPAGRAAG